MSEHVATRGVVRAYPWLALAGTLVGFAAAAVLVAVFGGMPDTEWGLMGVYLGITSIVTALPLGAGAWAVRAFLAPLAAGWSSMRQWAVAVVIACTSLVVNWGIPQMITALLYVAGR